MFLWIESTELKYCCEEKRLRTLQKVDLGRMTLIEGLGASDLEKNPHWCRMGEKLSCITTIATSDFGPYVGSEIARVDNCSQRSLYLVE